MIRRPPLVGLFLLLSLALLGAADGADRAAALPHLRLDVHLDPDTRLLAAQAVLSVRNGAAEFSLDRRFAVERILLNGTAVAVEPAAAEGRRNRWRIPIGRASRPAEILIAYRGVLDPLREADTREVLQALPPMTGPRGSFLPSRTGWYPEPPGLFSYTLRLDLPATQRGLVPGRLTAESQPKGRYRAEFAFARPAEGIDLIAGPYQVQERLLPRPGGSPIRLRTYFHPEIADLAPDYLASIDRYLALYGAWIGAYPFTEFSIASSPLPTGFGMPTMTYLGVDVLRLPFIRATSLGHEILHNWWGNGVYVDYTTGNWAEALTTFMADYTYTEQEGPAAARDLRLAWLRDLAAVPADHDFPLRRFTARTHGTSQVVGYHKGAFLFLMLRDRIGREAFDAALRAFWQRYRFREAGWTDLRHAFERASGKDLREFYTEWLDRRGAPQLAIEAATAERTPTGHRARLTLGQTGEAYTLRVPVVVRTAAGPVEQVVELRGKREEFVLALPGTPESAALDPDFRLVRRLAPGEAPPILRQAILDPKTVTVLLGEDAGFREAASRLAEKVLDFVPRMGEASALQDPAPVLLIGRAADVDAFLARHGLPGRPETLGTRGTAQVWAAYRQSGALLLVVSAQDRDALLALQRPLPHYGRQSYLIFEGATASERGIWPASPLEWKFRTE